jgi:hypothetical protein
MNTEELRALIWDDLFGSRTSRSIDEIAARTDQDVTVIRAAVDHDWFRVSGNQVSIAMAAPERRQYLS